MLPAAQMRGGLIAVLATAAVAFGVAWWHPARVAMQTLLLLPALFPSAPVDPLSLVTQTPMHEERSYPYAAGRVEANLFHASGSGQHGAIILLLGAGGLPRSHLAVHFAEAPARPRGAPPVPRSSPTVSEPLGVAHVHPARSGGALPGWLP